MAAPSPPFPPRMSRHLLPGRSLLILPPVKVHRWLAPPWQGHTVTRAPLPVLASATSRHRLPAARGLIRAPSRRWDAGRGEGAAEAAEAAEMAHSPPSMATAGSTNIVDLRILLSIPVVGVIRRTGGDPPCRPQRSPER